METEALTAASEIDFSVLALYLRATFTVKIVMLMLIFSSIWSWSIIIQKFINYRKARKNAHLFDKAFWSGAPLDQLYERVGSDPCLLYTSPSPRDRTRSRMPSSA